MIKILVDANYIERDMKGVGRYAYHLLQQLDNFLPHDMEILALVSERLDIFDIFSSRVRFLESMRYSDFRNGFILLPSLIREHGVEMVLSTNEALIGQLSVPRVVVCHDINELIWESQGLKRFGFRWLINTVLQWLRIRGLRKSDLLVCNSEFVRKEVCERYGIDPEKTMLAYCGIDMNFKHFQLDASNKLEKSKDTEYVLAFATGDVRENPELLSDILVAIRAADSHVSMVIAGINPNSTLGSELRERFLNSGLEENRDFRLVNFIPWSRRDELARLYENASLYLELSSHEGFGMQLAEALAAGIPCLSSRGGALPEIGGAYSHYYNNHDPLEIAGNVISILDQPLNKQRQLEQVAFAGRYNWTTTGKHVANQIVRIISLQKTCQP